VWFFGLCVVWCVECGGFRVYDMCVPLWVLVCDVLVFGTF